MSLLGKIRRWLGLDRASAPASEPAAPARRSPSGGSEIKTPSLPELRRKIEDTIDADDADRLVRLLHPFQDLGKQVLDQWEQEIGEAPPGAERDALARRITALVAIYARAFQDEGPLEHFRRNAPPAQQSAARLEEAQQAFRREDFDAAVAAAASGLDELPETLDDPQTLAVASSLVAVQGGVAVRRARWEEAQENFERSLEYAERAAQPGPLAAAMLNLLDVHTRRGQFDESRPFLERIGELVRDTPYEDVLGKLLVERGIGQTRAGDVDGAHTTFDLAVQIRPQWPFPWYQRAWTRFLAGDAGGALDDYREAAQRQPVFFTVQREIRCLEEVAAGRLSIDAYRTYCAIRDQVKERPDELAEAMEKMTERWPDFAAAYLTWAEARLVKSDPDGAADLAATALTKDPDPDTASGSLFLLWNVARNRQEEARAKEFADRLIEAYPNSPAARVTERVLEAAGRHVTLRWSFALDGTLGIEEVSPDQTPPPPESPS